MDEEMLHMSNPWTKKYISKFELVDYDAKTIQLMDKLKLFI